MMEEGLHQQWRNLPNHCNCQSLPLRPENKMKEGIDARGEGDVCSDGRQEGDQVRVSNWVVVSKVLA